MPCRDAEPFLGECISSLEGQTEPRFEILALDDGSTDRTREMLGVWADRDPRVRLFEPEGSGIVAALRRLSREARASRIARMDADDISRPERLAAQIRLLSAAPHVAACGTGVRYFPRPSRGSGYRRYETWLNQLADPGAIERDLFVECPIAHPTLMVRRTTFEAVGGYRETRGPEDYDLVLRLAAAGHALSNVPEVLHEWRLGDHRLSERSDRYSAGAFRRLKISFLCNGLVPSDRPLVIWGAGKVGKAFARAWLGAGAGRVAAFVDLDPRKIDQTIHGATVIGPSGLPGLDGRPFMLLAVGSPGARGEIREVLDEMEYVELEDYRAVA